MAGATSNALRSETTADLNEVVGHNSKTDPPLHIFESSMLRERTDVGVVLATMLYICDGE